AIRPGTTTAPTPTAADVLSRSRREISLNVQILSIRLHRYGPFSAARGQHSLGAGAHPYDRLRTARTRPHSRKSATVVEVRRYRFRVVGYPSPGGAHSPNFTRAGVDSCQEDRPTIVTFTFTWKEKTMSETVTSELQAV